MADVKEKRDHDDSLAIRLARQERDLKKQPCPAPYMPRLRGPSQIWKIFHRQHDALSFVSKLNEDLHVFSFESPSLGQCRGQRLFLVASYSVFWHYYRQLMKKQRHHYELIPEGVPCRLYFDLEFSREQNTGADGSQITHIFSKYLLAQLQVHFGVKCQLSDILQLDASTSKKYSCHLVVTNKSVVFQNNVQAGNFVKHIIDELWRFIQSNRCENQSRSGAAEVDSAVAVGDVLSVVEQHPAPTLGSISRESPGTSHIRAEEWKSPGSKQSGSCAFDADNLSFHERCHGRESPKITRQCPEYHVKTPGVSSVSSHRINCSASQVNMCQSKKLDQEQPWTTPFYPEHVPASTGSLCKKCNMRSQDNGPISGMRRSADKCVDLDVSCGSILNANPSQTRPPEYSCQHNPGTNSNTDKINTIRFRDCDLHCSQNIEPRREEPPNMCGNLEGAFTSCDPPQDQIGRFDAALRLSGLCLSDFQSLVIHNKDGEECLFCDTGVYTKNRNFRIYLSSKLGKDNPLVVAADNRYVPEGVLDYEEEIFMASLVTNVSCHDDSVELLSYHAADGPLRIPWSSRKPGPDGNSSRKSLEGHKASPYPEVDQFILSTLTKGGVQGMIRRWAYFEQDEIITYDILHNRWCERVQRHHRSNNIIMVANLRQGVYYQKCQDPDCRAANFKSKDYPLPECVLPGAILGSDDELSDAEVGDLTDAQLMSAISKLEDNSNWEITDEEMLGVEAGC